VKIKHHQTGTKQAPTGKEPRGDAMLLILRIHSGWNVRAAASGALIGGVHATWCGGTLRSRRYCSFMVSTASCKRREESGDNRGVGVFIYVVVVIRMIMAMVELLLLMLMILMMTAMLLLLLMMIMTGE
jgi:hypothetical protein